MVLVGSPKAAESANVGEEVEEFRKTGRRLIPISFDHSLEQSPWFSLINGQSICEEPITALGGKTPPSPATVRQATIDRIVNAEGFVSRNRRLRRVFAYTVGGIVVSLLASSLLAFIGVVRAQYEGMAAEVAEVRAKAGAWQADREASAAKKERVEAFRDKEIARADASRQQEIAGAFSQVSQAEDLRMRSSDGLQKSVRKAAEAMHRLSLFGITSVEADGTLRRGLELLQPPSEKIPLPIKARAVALSEDAGLVAVAAQYEPLTLRKRGSSKSIGKPLPVSSECCRTMAFVSGEESLAVVDGGTSEQGELKLCSGWLAPVPRCEIVARDLEFSPSGVFSRDGKSFAAVRNGESNVVTIWRLGSHPAIISQTRLPQDLSLRQIALSAEGKTMAISTYSSARRLEEIYPVDISSSPARILPPFLVAGINGSRFVDGLAVSQSGDQIAAVLDSLDPEGPRTVTLWNLRIGEDASLELTAGDVQISFASFRGEVLLVDGHSDVKVFDLPMLTEVARLPREYLWPDIASLSADGRFFGFQDGDSRSGYTVSVWRLTEGLVDSQWRLSGLAPNAALSGDGHYLIRPDGRGLGLYDTFSRQEINKVEYPCGDRLFAHLYISSEGHFLGCSRSEGFFLRDVHDKKPSRLDAASFSEDERLYAVRDDFAIKVKNADGSVVTTIQEKGFRPILHPRGSYLAVVDYDDRVSIWKIPRKGNEARLLGTPDLRVQQAGSSVVWSPRGDYLVLIPRLEQPAIWATSTAKIVARLGSGRPIELLGFVSGGKQIVVVDSAGVLGVYEPSAGRRLWHVKLAEKPRRLLAHPREPVVALELSGTVEFWDLAKQVRVAQIALGAGLEDMAFTSDGRQIVTIDSNGTIRRGLWRPEDLIREAYRRLQAAR